MDSTLLAQMVNKPLQELIHAIVCIYQHSGIVTTSVIVKNNDGLTERGLQKLVP